MAVQAQLEPGDDNPVPVTSPTLPAGVTHVWVAGHWCHGVLTWLPGRGWLRTPLMWSSEGPITSRTWSLASLISGIPGPVVSARSGRLHVGSETESQADRALLNREALPTVFLLVKSAFRLVDDIGFEPVTSSV
jgi:hypothetical protein